MANDSSFGRQAGAPAAGTAEPSLGGMLLLLLACLPYALLVAMLPHAGEFPNEGGGESRLAWGFQQLRAYAACGTTMVLLWLALWRASRSGGIAEWARRTIPVLVPAAGDRCVCALGLSAGAVSIASAGEDRWSRYWVDRGLVAGRHSALGP